METAPLTFTPSVFLPATTVKEDIVPAERAAVPQLGDPLEEEVAIGPTLGSVSLPM